jgi:holo-[acyl-carrier protein] synthase
MLGVGVDIVNIDRMRKILNRDNGSFLKRVFTRKEILNARKFEDEAEYFSKVFAFKESFAKAKGCGFRNVMPNDIEVWLSGGLKSCISLSRKIKAYFKKKKITLIDIEYLKIENNIICRLIADLDEYCEHEKI